MKNIMIIVLLLLVMGLYFFTEDTKEVLDITGNALKDAAKKAGNEIQEESNISDKIDNATNLTAPEGFTEINPAENF